jgi:hypothetical protein
MLLNNKLRDESSRAISSILVTALEACRQGDVELVENLGLSLETMQKLDQLKADQILNISGNYMRDQSLMDVFNFNSEKMAKIIEIAAKETKLFEMIDEYLRRGACKKMMHDLFGMRSTQIANRKKFLSIPTVKGRITVTTLDEQRQVYDVWLAAIKIPDYRDRLLLVSKETGLMMSKIYREVQIIEEIQNQSNKRICA